MDPIANLKEQLDRAQLIESLDDRWREEGVSMNEAEQTDYIEAAGELAALVLALDEWRRNGGFDPYGG